MYKSSNTTDKIFICTNNSYYSFTSLFPESKHNFNAMLLEKFKVDRVEKAFHPPIFSIFFHTGDDFNFGQATVANRLVQQVYNSCNGFWLWESNGQSTKHSSQFQSLCSTKRPSETLQNLPYFIYTKTEKSTLGFRIYIKYGKF